MTTDVINDFILGKSLYFNIFFVYYLLLCGADLLVYPVFIPPLYFAPFPFTRLCFSGEVSSNKKHLYSTGVFLELILLNCTLIYCKSTQSVFLLKISAYNRLKSLAVKSRLIGLLLLRQINVI